MHRDIKKAIYHKDYCASESSRVIDSIFAINEEIDKFGNGVNVSCDHNRKAAAAAVEESFNISGRPSLGTRSQASVQGGRSSACDRATASTNSDKPDFKHPKDVLKEHTGGLFANNEAKFSQALATKKAASSKAAATAKGHLSKRAQKLKSKEKENQSTLGRDQEALAEANGTVRTKRARRGSTMGISLFASD